MMAQQASVAEQPDETTVAATHPTPAPFVSARAILVGVALMIADGFLVFQAEAVRGSRITFAAPFANVIFLLTLLALINSRLKRCHSRFAFSAAEMIVLYVMLSVQTAVSSAFGIHWILYSITYGFWYDTPERGWTASFGRHFSTWITIHDKEALRGFYLGNSTLFTPEHLTVWARPMISWALFFAAMAVVFMAMASLVSQQWIRRERLTFPIVELPFQMVSSGDTFWRRRLLWIGFGLAAGIGLINGLSEWFPFIPTIPVRRTNLAPLFTSKPWDGIVEFNLSFYPFIIGICYLAPVDLAFSSVFFYLVIIAMQIIGRATGLENVPQYPFYWEQGFGAAMAILLATVLGLRPHLRNVWRQAMSRETEIDAPALARLYRKNLLTVGLGSLFLVAWLTAAGLWWWAAIVVVLIYWGVGLVAARIRAESGFPTHMLDDMSGTIFLMTAVGGNALGMKNIALLGLLNGFTKFNTYHVMPHQVEGFRLADRMGIRQGSITLVIVLAILISVPATLLIHVSSLYQLGAGAKANWGAHLGYDTWGWTLPRWMSGSSEASGVAGGVPNLRSLAVLSVSFLFCIFLMAMRYRFFWFPLHPVGVVLGNGLRLLWFAVLVAVIAKWLTLRYSGLRGYRAALPFFLGLILGDILMGMAWILISVVFNTPTYVFFP